MRITGSAQQRQTTSRTFADEAREVGKLNCLVVYLPL
jgi:hypothetical protein